MLQLIGCLFRIIKIQIKLFSTQENENGALRKFLEVIMDIGGQVLDDINNFGDVTILAPSNEAWNRSAIDNIIRFA